MRSRLAVLVLTFAVAGVAAALPSAGSTRPKSAVSDVRVAGRTVTATLVLPGTGSTRSNANCGGLAPVLMSCAAGGVVEGSIAVSQTVGLEFSGELRSSIDTDTGSISLTCLLPPLIDPICQAPVSTGTMPDGQDYALRGSITTPIGLGNWSVVAHSPF